MKIKKLISFTFLLFLFIHLFTPLKIKAMDSGTQVNLFQITTDGSQQSTPLIYKDLVVYTNFGGSQGNDIWGYDLRTYENFPIIEKEGIQFLTGLYKNLIIYENTEPNELTTDLWAYDLHSQEDMLIAGGVGSQTSGVTNGKEVIYIDGGACGKLHSYDLNQGESTLIVELTCHPFKIWKDTVVLMQTDPNGTNVVGYDLTKKVLFEIATADAFQEAPDIHNDTVVWLHRLSGAYGDYNAIKMKDLKTGEEKTIYESSIDSLQSPAISDKYVVWSQNSAQHVGGIMGADIKTGEVFEIQSQGPHQNSHTSTAIWKDVAVWMAWRTGNGDIYGAELSNQDYLNSDENED